MYYDKSERRFEQSHLYTKFALASATGAGIYFYFRNPARHAVFNKAFPDFNKTLKRIVKSIMSKNPRNMDQASIVNTIKYHQDLAKPEKFLSKAEIERINIVKKTEITAFTVPEFEFKRTVVRRFNPIIYDTIRNDPQEIQRIFNKIVDEGLDASKELRLILGDELEKMDAKRARMQRKNVFIAQHESEIAKSKELLQQKIGILEAGDEEAKRLASFLKNIPPDRIPVIEIPSGSPVRALEQFTRIIEPKDRLVPFSVIAKRANLDIQYSNLKFFLAQVKNLRADPEAMNFFSGLDTELRTQFHQLGGIVPRITYALKNTPSDLSAEIKVLLYATNGQTRETINLSIPVSKGKIIRAHGCEYIMEKYKPARGSMPGKDVKLETFYTRILSGMRQRAKNIAWNATLGGKVEFGNQQFKTIIRSAVDDLKILEGAPVVNKLRSETYRDDSVAISMGKFSSSHETILKDRYGSMAKLKMLLRTGNGKLNLPDKYLFVDTETLLSTGPRHVPHEITIAMVENGSVADLKTWKIHPQSIVPNYSYPENDLRLSFGNKTREQVMNEFQSAMNIKDAEKDIQSFISSKIKPGEKIPVAGFNTIFDLDVLRRHAPATTANFGPTWDALNFHRALTLDVNKSISQISLGMDYGMVTLDKAAKRFRLTDALLKKWRSDPILMKTLKKSNSDFYLKLMTATNATALRKLAFHSSDVDVLLGIEVLQTTTRQINKYSSEVLNNLSNNMMDLQRGFAGWKNPVLQAELLGRGANINLSVGQILRGKKLDFDIKKLLPLSHWVDPTRPFSQRLASAELAVSTQPSLITKEYGKISKKFGNMFKTVSVLDIMSPHTMLEAGLIDASTAEEFAIKAGSKTLRIPISKNLKLHYDLQDALQKIENATPEQKPIVIRELQQRIAKDFKALNAGSSYMPPNTLLAEIDGKQYTTETPLFSVIENIDYNTTNREIVVKLATADKPGVLQYPMKMFTGEFKGEAASIPSLKKNLGVDMVVYNAMPKRGRPSTIITGQLQKITSSLQAMYPKLKNDPGYMSLVEEFVKKTNRTGFLRLKSVERNDTIYFEDSFIPNLRMQKQIIKNVNKFVGGGWFEFMHEFSQKIDSLKKMHKIQYLPGEAVNPVWTGQDLHTFFEREWNIENKTGRKWSSLAKDEREIFTKKLEEEQRNFLKGLLPKEYLTKSQAELVNRLKLQAGHQRILMRVDNSWGFIMVQLASRASESGETYAKAKEIHIPRLDQFMIQGKLGKQLSRTFTAAQEAMATYKADMTNVLRFNEVDAKLAKHYPIISAHTITPESFMEHKAFQDEISMITKRTSRYEVVETGEIYTSYDKIPKKALEKYTIRQVDMSRYMNPKTLENLYGERSNMVEFRVGGKITYLPRPALSMLRGSPGFPLPSGNVMTIVSKEVATWKNLVDSYHAYERAITDADKAQIERQFYNNVKLMRQTLLDAKTVYIDMTTPTIEGVQGKVSLGRKPGMAEALGLPPKSMSHITSGFGVQLVSLDTMGNKYFKKALESHRLPSGDFIGGTGNKYKDIDAFRKAILDGNELLAGHIARIPAEGRNAWLNVFYSIRKDAAKGLYYDFRDATMSHFDADGDIGNLLINAMPPEERETFIRGMVRKNLRDHVKHKELAERVMGLRKMIEEHESGSAPNLSKIKREISALEKTQEEFHIFMTGTGIAVRMPKPGATLEQIKLGTGDEMRHVRMDLFKYHDIQAVPYLKQLTTKEKGFVPLDEAAAELEGLIGQIATKTATPATYRPKILAEMAIRRSSLTVRQQRAALGVIEQYASKITSLKKYSLEGAEQMVDAALEPWSPNSMSYFRDVFGAKKRMSIELLGRAVMETRKRGMFGDMMNEISFSMKQTPVSPTQLRLLAPFEERKMSSIRRTAEYWGKENLLNSLKRHVTIGSVAAMFALAALPILGSSYNDDEFPPLPTSTNLIQPIFPAPTHIQMLNPPQYPITRWQPRELSSLLITQKPNTTVIRRDRMSYPNPMKRS